VISALIVAVVLVAFAIWAVAAWSLLRMLLVAPDPLTVVKHSVWWNWPKLEGAVGEAGLAHVRRFKKAFVAFFAAIVCGFCLALVQLLLSH
jgi:ABC-type nitrate/sulfonate/bicarbonate transport system permease component